MLKNKKEENKNKRNLAIGATSLAATGLGAAYLLSRKKPTNVANKVKNTTRESSNLAPKPYQLGNNQPRITAKTNNAAPQPFQLGNNKPRITPKSPTPSLSELITKPFNIQRPVNSPSTLSTTENLISKNIDKSPVNLGVEKVTGKKGKTASIWDKVAEKIDKLPSVQRRRRGQQALPGSKPPKGLLRAGYDTPQVDWDSPVQRVDINTIREKIRRQALLTGAATPQALPMARVKANVAVKGYRRKDGTFVTGYQRRIDKVLRAKRIAQLEEGLITEATSRKNKSVLPQRLLSSNLPQTRQTIAEKVRERTQELLQRNIDDIQAKTVTRPTLVESGEIITDPSVSEKAKEVLRGKFTNANVRRDRVHTLITQADTLAKELEEKAAQKFNAKKQNYKDRVKELQEKIKKYEPNFFERTLSTDKLDVEIADLRTNLDKTLNDPFAEDYFADSKPRIESLQKQLGEELKRVDNEIKKPQEYLDAVENMYREIDSLKKEYRTTLEDVYRANQQRVDYLQQQLEQEKAILENLTESDITSEFLRKERSSFLQEISKRSNRQFFGRTSNVQRALNDLRSRVYNQRTTIRNKLREQTNFKEYREHILSLQTSLNTLPKTRRNLTRNQRAALRQTESFPKMYKKLYGQLFKNIEDLHKFEKEFMSRYREVMNDIDKNTDDIFSNKTFEEYMEQVSTSAEKVEIADITFRENLILVDKIYDPNEVVTRYIDLVNRVKDVSDVNLTQNIVPFSKETSSVSLSSVAQRKRVILQGGYIDGKKYGGVLSDLKINTDGSQIKTGLLNGYGEKYIAMKSSVVDYNDARLAKLAEEYITTKKRLLKNIDNSMSEITENIDYDTWKKNPELGTVLGKIDDNVRKYNADFGTEDISTSFFKQRQKIEDMRGHLSEIGRVKPEFVVENGQIKLNTIKMTDLKSSELNQTAIKKLDLDYAKVVGKTRSKRVTMANLYYSLDKAGITVEGKDTIFQHLRGGVEKLKENEKLFFDALTKNEQITLQNFSNYRLDEHFEKYYYTNALSYVLRGNGKNLVMTPDVSKQLGLTTPDVLDRINDYLGRNKPVDLQKRKLDEVKSIIRDLRSLGEDVKLTPFLEVEGKKIPFQNGLMGVIGLPAILPGEQYRNRNFLVRKLQKTLGLSEKGTPLYNPRLAKTLSGTDITDRESLKRLLSDIQSKYYGESDLNTLYMATQLNSEYLRSYDSALYLYNFSEQYQNIATF